MLNWAHIHLVLTHILVVGVGVVIAFLLAGLARRSRVLTWVSLQMFVALALLSIAVYLTSRPASHQMRELPGVSRETIHRHSSVADFAFGGIEALGARSLGALFKVRISELIPVQFVGTLLGLALVVMILMIWTANLGGRIRYPKIDAVSATQQLSLG